VIASICLSGTLIAICFSITSLVLHWTKRHSTPETDRIDARIESIKVQHLDLLDKVEHWRKRDSVRRARQGAEDKATAAEADPSLDPAAYKNALRRKAIQNNLGVVSR